MSWKVLKPLRVLIPTAAGLFVSLPFMPILACLVAVIVSFQGANVAVNRAAAPVGLGVALVAWLLCGYLFRTWGIASQANASACAQIRERLDRLSSLFHEMGATPHFECEAQRVAYGEARRLHHRAEWELRKDGVYWATATGYLRLWTLVHRVQEAIIEVEEIEALLEDAYFDEQCLLGSTMPAGGQLLTKLRRGVVILGRRVPGADQFLTEQPPAAASATCSADPSGKDEPSHVAGCSTDETRAVRAALRVVRREINDFRDAGLDGLVRARNRLMRTMVLTGVIAFVLLSLALLKGAPQSAIVATSAFFVIGALVGLFNRLYIDAGTETAIEDFGLTNARLPYTVLICGLAAIGGVVVTAMLAKAAGSTLWVPQGTDPTDWPPDLTKIFSLQSYRFGLIVAAVFGLTPNLLITRLAEQTEQFKADLKSTSSVGRS